MKLSYIAESGVADPNSKRQLALKAKQQGIKVVYDDGEFKVIAFLGLEATEALMTYSAGTGLCTKFRKKAEAYLSHNPPLYMVFRGKERLLLADRDFFEVSYTDDIPLQDAGLTPAVATFLQKVKNEAFINTKAARNISIFLAGESPF